MLAPSGTGQRFLARTPLASMLIDRSGTIVAANQPMHSTLGYPPNGLVGMQGLDLVHPDQREAMTTLLTAILAGTHPFGVSVAVTLRRGDGGWVHTDSVAADLLDEPGFDAILVTAREVGVEDATPDRRSAWFEAVIAGSDDLVQVLDADGRYLWSSAATDELLGVPAASLVGQTIFQGEHIEANRAWLEVTKAAPGPHPPIIRALTRADGSEVQLEVRANNALDDPAIAGIVVHARDISARVAADEALQFTADLVERAPIAVVTTDVTGTVTSWNPEAERITGWPAGDALGRPYTELGLDTPDALRDVGGSLDLLVAGGTIELETTIRSRGDTVVPIYLVMGGLLDAEGSLSGFLTFSLDLREQTDVRQALATTEARWLALTRQAHELVAVVDLDSVVSWAGPGFANLLGIDPATLVGRPLRDLTHPADQDRPGGRERLLAHPGSSYRREYRLRHADGSWRVFDAVVTDLRHEPAVEGVVVTAQDITGRVAAEEANSRMAQAIDVAGGGALVADADGVIRAWNRGAEALLGYTAEEIVGQSMLHIVPAEFHAQREVLYATMLAGEPMVFDTERIHRDGRRVPLSAIATPVSDPSGQVTGMSAVFFDITEQRQLERERDTRARQTTAVAALGQRALAGVSLDDLLRDACELVAETLQVPHAHVLRISDDSRFHELAAGVGIFEDRVGKCDPVEMRQWTELADGPGRSIAVEDFDAQPELRPRVFDGSAVRSGTLCAIEGRVRPIGFLAALADEARHYTEEEIGFVQSVANVLGTAIDRARVTDEMQHRALHDELTGLPNRALLLDRLTQALARIERRGGTLGLLFIDLDRFKRVNDTLGHQAGDAVLVATARRLLDTVRLGDTVARTGGDEFLVLTEDVAEPDDALQLAARIFQAIDELVPIDGRGVRISSSIGVAIAQHNVDPEALVRDADLAMYRAKETGRARVQLFDETMRDEVMSRMAMEESLRAAVATDGVHVVFQPQVRLTDGTPVGIEALARWDHPQLGAVPPSSFVGLAEEIGVLDTITRAVLRASCEALRDARQGCPDLVAAVNLSPRQLGRQHILELLDDCLADFALPPSSLIIEITETGVLDDRTATGILGEIRSRGVRVSIDDFGTGYSSLARLARLPVDEVKIDRAFVAGVDHDRGCAAVVSAAITLAGLLDLRVVAEGIETEAQRERLLELGCVEGQGWLFSDSLGHDALLEWLAARRPDRRATDRRT